MSLVGPDIFIPLPILGMWIPLAFPAPRCYSKDRAFRQACGVKNPCMIYVTEPIKAPIQIFKIW